MREQKVPSMALFEIGSDEKWALNITRNICSLRGALPHWHRSSANVIYFWNVIRNYFTNKDE